MEKSHKQNCVTMSVIEMLDFIIHVVKYLSGYLVRNQKNVIFQLNPWPLANIASKY